MEFPTFVGKVGPTSMNAEGLGIIGCPKAETTSGLITGVRMDMGQHWDAMG